MMKALQSFKTSQTRHTKTQCHIPEDQILKRGNASSNHCLENEVLSLKNILNKMKDTSTKTAELISSTNC
jgi:hypothetical protein